VGENTTTTTTTTNNNNNNNNNNVTVPADRNVAQEESEKKLKYKNLGIEIQRMWNLNCAIIPVITGATRIVTRSLRKNLEIYQENIR
jgi:hypothetical protein